LYFYSAAAQGWTNFKYHHFAKPPDVMCHTAQQVLQRWGDSKNVLYQLGLT
jgi:hypothetical protein